MSKMGESGSFICELKFGIREGGILTCVEGVMVEEGI